jgi:hypothetical protein
VDSRHVSQIAVLSFKKTAAEENKCSYLWGTPFIKVFQKKKNCCNRDPTKARNPKAVVNWTEGEKCDTAEKRVEKRYH